MTNAIVTNLFSNMKSGLSLARSGVRRLWATSAVFQACVVAPPIFVGGYLLLTLALLVF